MEVGLVGDAAETLRALLPRLRQKQAGEWRKTENNRRARYYNLTPAGKKQLGIELAEFEKVMRAITGVIQPA